MPLTYMESEKGKQMLLFEGFIFYKDKVDKKKTYWKCKQFKSGSCHARIQSADDEILKTVGIHNHSADAALTEAGNVINIMKVRVQNSFDSPNQIISSAAGDISAEVAPKLPTISSIKKTLRRSRNIASFISTTTNTNPKSAKDLVLPEPYKLTSKNENFLLYDSGEVEERILVFGTYANLTLLEKSKHWYMDGTFKTVPSIFYQLYTIHGIIKGESIVPLVYALLPNKKTETYIKLLSELKNLEPRLNPSSVMMDFEKSMIKAFETEFPETKIRGIYKYDYDIKILIFISFLFLGCFFHFKQAVYRKVQEKGLKIRYDTDSKFAQKIRLLCALAFLPAEKVVDVFEEMLEKQVIPDEAQDIVNYFEDVWVGRPDRRNKRRQPLFKVDIWNCYSNVTMDLPKTNNKMEGWHNSFSSLLSCSHPVIWKFIDTIKMEQAKNEFIIEKYNAGEDGPPQKKKYKNQQACLKSVVAGYNGNDNSFDNMLYLKSLAYNFNL